LRQLLHQQPDATLEELQGRSGVACSRMAVWRALRKLRLSRKKKTLRAQERDTPRVRARRRAFQQKLAGIDPSRYVFVDESGVNTAMTRLYGRAPTGQRVYGSVPGQWQSLTVISAVRLSGVVASLAFPGATDTAAFRTDVERLLVPELRPGDVVIWENLKPHHDAQVVGAVQAAGAQVEPAPPWSPDLLPTEKLWSKVKGWLRTVGARSAEAIYAALGVALDKVCPQDIQGWFQSCGLCATQA
jgi:transposase